MKELLIFPHSENCYYRLRIGSNSRPTPKWLFYRYWLV